MKRSILFWPLVVGAAVFVLWVVFCLFVIGLPDPSYGPGGYWSPARHVLNDLRCAELARWMQSVVRGVWTLFPYTGLSKPIYDFEGSYLGPGELDISVTWFSPGERRSLHVMLDLGRDVLRPPDGYGVHSLSPREVHVHVVLMPGAHFALAAFVLVGVISVPVRLLMRFIPEDAAPPPGGKQE